ncbi:MAG TPA: hypothetical protein DCF63_02950, partial [Planctomycetaceae bacterium]|nr:hypothetical protein [Planctomycetaceae bacterium]
APKVDPTLETNSMADETVDSVSPQQTPGQSEMRLSLDSAGSSSPFLLAELTDGRMVLLKDDHSPLTKSRLIAPPSPRSQVESPIWKLTLAGPSVIDVELQGDRLKISPLMLRGLFSCRQVDLPMRVHAAGGVFEVVFRNPSAWLSVEVGHRQISRGSIQEANTYLPVLVMVAGCDQPDASGPLIEINQTDSARSVSLMEPGRGMAVVGDGRQGLEEFALLNPPRWYSKRSISVMQQLAADDLVSGLQAGSENLVQRLREMSNDDRPEVAALAIELSLLLGDPQPFASQLLADDRLRSHWNNTLALTRQVLSSRRETIEAMGQALTATHGQDSGAELMELLLGLGQERLGGDGLAALIKGLDSQQLPVRVLSAFELQQLTGQSFGYLPHAPIRSSLQQWRQQLNSGKLKIMEVGDPIWERTALP